MQHNYRSIYYDFSNRLRGIVSRSEYGKLLACIGYIVWWCKGKNDDSLVKSNKSTELLGEYIKTIEESNPEIENALSFLLFERFPSLKKNEVEINGLINDCYSVFVTMDEVRRFTNFIIENNEHDNNNEITPTAISQLIVNMMNVKKQDKVIDYFSGTGSISRIINETYKDFLLEYYGEELNSESYYLSKLLFSVNDVKNHFLKLKDVHDLSDSLKRRASYNQVIMDAPFGMKSRLTNSEVFIYGQPNGTSTDWANVQIALYSLSIRGRAFVTGTSGMLSRTHDMEIRKAVIEDDLLEAVILLPSSMYSYTAISTALMVFNRSKDKSKVGKVILIDATGMAVRMNRGQNTLSDESIDRIVYSIEDFELSNINGVIVENDAFREHQYNLGANVYLNTEKIKNALTSSIKLSEVAEVLSGVQVNKNDIKKLKKDATHYYLSVKHIQEDGVVYDEDEKIRDKKVSWYGRYDIREGDLLFTSKGTTSRMVVVPNDFKPSFISGNLTIIRLKEGKYNPYVLKKYLESNIGKLVLENITTGSTVQVINAKQLAQIDIPEYSVELLAKAGRKIKESKEEYRRNIKEAEEKLKNDVIVIDEMLGI